MKPIDLRSDTVTLPTQAMRDAMASAEVGDDVYGEDPTIHRLEEMAAALVGKEAALFVPSGTMANQIALRIHTRPGDVVLAGENSHVLRYEAGAASALWGLQIETVGRGGLFGADELLAALPPKDVHCAPATLVSLEKLATSTFIALENRVAPVQPADGYRRRILTMTVQPRNVGRRAT